MNMASEGAERIRECFRKNLNHDPDPVPYISDLMDARIKLENNNNKEVKGYNIGGLPTVPLPPNVNVEIIEKVAIPIAPNTACGLVVDSCLWHERLHGHQIFCREGFNLYRGIELFIEGIKFGNGFKIKNSSDLSKLEYSPTIAQYIELSYPEVHILGYEKYGYEWLLEEYAKVVANNRLGEIFLEQVEKSNDHKHVLNLLYTSGLSLPKLEYIAVVYTYSKLKLNEIIKIVKSKSFQDLRRTSIEELGIELVIEDFDKLGFKSNSSETRRQFLSKQSKKLFKNIITYEDLLDALIEYDKSLSYVIYDNKDKKHYIFRYRKPYGDIWKWFYVDISIAYQILRAKIQKYRQVRCPFSFSEQFSLCSKCRGLLYPVLDCKKCKFIREWIKSNGLSKLYSMLKR